MEGLEILNEVSQEALIVLGILGVILALILFLLMFYTPYWVYKDANKRKMFGGGWGLIVLFFIFFGIIPGLIFLLIYLFIRNPIGGKKETEEMNVNEPVFGERRKENNIEDDDKNEGQEDIDGDTGWEELEEDEDLWEDFDDESP